jgi:hypothetical protein
MDKVLKLEELADLAICLVALYYQPLTFRWWTWPILFLLPDIGMLGYLINTSVGAVTYNLFHHKLIAIMILGVGWYMNVPVLTLSGLLLYGHSSFDRVMGYGLKYFDSFKHTHLGMM